MRFNPFPEIKTERLFLRKIEQSDCEIILFLRSNHEVNKYIQRPENRQTKNLADAQKFIQTIDESRQNNKSISWGICLKNTNEIIGTICLWNFSEDNKTAEIGYDLNPDFQNKGIMNEALKTIIDFGFNKFNFEKLEAFTQKNNSHSKKLLEKNGFKINQTKKDTENHLNLIYELF